MPYDDQEAPVSNSTSYNVRVAPQRRRRSGLARLRARAAAIPGLDHVSDAVCDRLLLTEALSSAITEAALRLEMTEDHRGSAIWAERHDGLVLAAVATDDCRLEIDIANTRGSDCEELVTRLAATLAEQGFELGLEHHDHHNQPSGVRLIPPVRPHLVAGGANPSAALLDSIEAAPAPQVEVHPVTSELAQPVTGRRQVGR